MMRSSEDSEKRSFKWKPWTFLSLALIFTIVAVSLKHSASSNSIGATQVAAVPQVVRVFTSDRNAQVTVSVNVGKATNGRWGSEILLNIDKATPGSEVLITSSTKPEDNANVYRKVGDPIGGRPDVWAAIFSVKEIEREQQLYPWGEDQPGVGMGDFKVGTVLYDQGGVLDAHLPLLANEFRNTQPAGTFEPTIFSREHGTLLDTQPGANYQKLSTVQYFVPIVLHTTEELDNVATQLSNSQIGLDVPSSGTVAADNFRWSGREDLEAKLSATDFDALDRRDNDAFLSGIAFALAAAALIAWLQELKSEVSLPLRPRQVSSSESNKMVRRDPPPDPM